MTCRRGPKPKATEGWEAYLEWLKIECDCRTCQEREF